MKNSMGRRDFLKSAAAGAAAAMMPWERLLGDVRPAALPVEKVQGRPNIVLIYADDLGYGDVGCYGATKVKTPHIDRLAREGMMFTDAHAASAVCSPSRYCLLTGRYPWRIDCWNPLGQTSGLIIDPAEMTVPKLLKQHGYATACIGKWHLGFGNPRPNWNGKLAPGPLEVGFDHYFGVPVVSSGPPFVYVENHGVAGFDPSDPFDEKKPCTTERYPEKNWNRCPGGAKAAHALYKDQQIAGTLTGKAVDWLQKNQGKPFFLYLATTNIHHPLTPHPRFKGTSQCGPYGDFIHELDWVVGEVLKTLDDLKLADNTLVIFSSDNGGMLNDGGRAAWQAGHRLNGRLLGFKFGAWEGGHRVPFIVRWPPRVKAGAHSDQLLCNADLLATVAAILGYTLRADEGPDSFDMLPALTATASEPIRDHMIVACHMRRLGLREGKWVYIEGQGSGGFGNGLKEIAFTRQANSDITPEGKINPDAPPDQLYDLEADLSEGRNVYRRYPEVAGRLKRLLAEYRAAPGTRAKTSER